MHWARVGGARNAKNRLLHTWVATGDFLVGKSAGNAKTSYCFLGSDRGFLVETEFLFGSVSRQKILVSQHGSQILSHRDYRKMAFLVVTGILILCRDDVVTEVFLSRPRRPRQEVRYRDRVWPWVRNFMLRHGILSCDRVWSRPRVVLVMIGYS